MTFVALTDFYSDELKSQYCKGLTYTIRPDNNALAVQAKRWANDGKILDTVVAQKILRGQGTVTVKPVSIWRRILLWR